MALDAAPPLSGPQATRSAVLSSAGHADVLHLACHGDVDPYCPSRSTLVLADGYLTVGQLTEAQVSSTWLVYLSACWTARPSLLLPEQPLHVASAFESKGSRHVVCTLWPIPDMEAVDIAKGFYRHLEDADPATALHRAVGDVRDTARDHPWMWAAFIHIGA